MIQSYEKLIAGIIISIFGVIFIIFFKRIAKVLVLSENVFWKNVGIKTNTSEGYMTFAQFFVLFVGIIFLIVGTIAFLQFFKDIK